MMAGAVMGPGPRMSAPDGESDQAGALCVEVSAWRRYDGGIDGGRETLNQADGVGVYIRNPLALHVRDFEPGVGTLDQARAAAFEWADALAAHLGCKVWAVVPRPAAPAAPEYDAATLAEAAACLWEAVLQLRSLSGGEFTSPAAELIESEFDREGAAAVRWRVCGWAAEAETAWRALPEDIRDAYSFDWEFCPRWVRHKLESQISASAQAGFQWEPGQ